MQGLQKLLSFSTPIILQPIPRQRSIDVVVGKPVQFPKKQETMPEAEYVNLCHKLYLDELEKLYNANKSKYGYTDMPLEFL